MKNLENYVCTFEQAKKLKELGVEQGSLYYWADSIILQWRPHKDGWRVVPEVELHGSYLPKNSELYSAFTSQELGELIEEQINKLDIGIYQCMSGIEFIQYDFNTLGCFYVPRYDMDEEACARAEFLIYLLESKQCQS